jgi:hypothetical protein
MDSPGRKKKSDFQSEKVNRELEGNNQSKSKSPNKKSKAKENNGDTIQNNKTRKKVIWNKNFVKIVDVISYKKYNLANTHDDPSSLKEKVRCNCIIF